MTSMPASRRARAMTLAPRSWPSRQGLATSTRILRSSTIEPFILTTKGWAGHEPQRNTAEDAEETLKFKTLRPLRPRRHLFWIFELGVAPQIPAGDRAVGLPGAGDFQDLFGFGHQPLAVSPFNGGIDAVIGRGHDIEATQRKDEEHLRRPHAN